MDIVEALEQKYFASGVKHLGDTQVIPHIDAFSYWSAINDALKKAVGPDDVIYMTAWLIDGRVHLTENGPELAELLHAKAVLGVDVRLIVWTGRFLVGKDMIDNRGWWDSELAKSIETRAGGYAKIVKNNVRQVREFRMFNPDKRDHPPLIGSVLADYGGGKTGSRHQKTIIVYNKATNDLRAFVGGIDFDWSRLAVPGHPTDHIWHDAGIELRGGAAAEVWEDFRTRWHEGVTLPNRTFRDGNNNIFFNNPETRSRPPVPPAPRPVMDEPTFGVRVLRSYFLVKESPLFGDDIPWDTLPPQGIREVLATYIKAIDSTEPTANFISYIYIEDQGLNVEDDKVAHDGLFPAIVRAANRGVRVIFVVPGVPDPTDGGHGNEFMSESIQNMIAQIQPDRRINFVMYRVKDTIIHSKVMIIDDEFVATGSANFCNRSMVGRDTELHTAVVHAGMLPMDLRVNLWADHLRVDPTNRTVHDELAILHKSLGLFRREWGSGVSFPHPDSKFEPVGPRP